MTFLISALSFLGVIILLVMAHEIGHFVTAKLTGVTVEEFGLFYPPRLLSFKYKGTIYSLNAIPVGGFVKMVGESGEADEVDPGALSNKKTWVKVLVLGAGSLMNFILPVILFAMALMIPHNEVNGTVVIQEVSENSPAMEAGMLPGDIILEADGESIGSTNTLSRYIQLNLGNEMDITLTHENGVTETVTVVPRWNPPADQGSVGILPLTTDYTIDEVSYPFWEAIPDGFKMSIETFVLFKNGIIGMFVGNTPFEVTGPVGIAQAAGEIAQAGMSPLLEFAAFLSMNLAIVNLFPIPALDGGRIFFIVLQGLRGGRKISPKKEALIHAAGFALLMVFFVAISIQDIIRIVNGNSLLGG